MKAIFKRELNSYFHSPIAYVCIGVLLALYGFFYYNVLLLQTSTYISSVYSSMFLFNMLVIPIITMRSFSEERKNKTDQALLTAPVGTYAIAFGKFLAALLVFAVSLAGSLIPAFVIGIFSSPNWAIIFGNVLGTLFYGAAMIAISMFLSSLTENQIVAAISSMGIAVFLMVIDQIGSIVSNPVVTQIINWISFNTRYKTFTSGVFDLSSLVFFLSVAAAFLFLTARRLEGRRWN